ncbi:MAG: aminoacyl-tRNA hydrolase [Candidatus Auribacter fodinae]|jgi:PTH1 family peptidyl-tRNA hydrolase|uniref:Peptidyl-tRNA hydrolase n=1 Tax=Candidatus Auribacter fodinae TaxID=2093366 RepID=A0A3A4R6G8_9BACT|nr:MAG: aminoacyl-tRNA hydrolase [Candidatus Auribacter fodinae]
MERPLYIIGLGNPGPEYSFTRHNAGFMVLDLLQRAYNARFSRLRAGRAHCASLTIEERSVELVKPETFMNRSGQVLNALELEQTDDGTVANLLVVYDDLHLPLGAIRYREQGSHGGHNGMRSIIDTLGHQRFHRLRVGVGVDRPVNDLHSFVLGTFTKSELELLSDVLNTACESIQWYIQHGIHSAMNRYNSKVA